MRLFYLPDNSYWQAPLGDATLSLPIPVFTTISI
ncbi:hypothetical protein XM69_c21326 [Vibrio parahaemolyticus]|nr:hypothetical protein XM69_c21326 [Vibrio parahaemolyticus]